MLSSMAWIMMTVMPFAFPTRPRTELNLEILVVAAMSASSSWPWRRCAAALFNKSEVAGSPGLALVSC